MSTYIPIELQREIRTAFADNCAYCQSAESLTIAIFEIEHIVPRSAGGVTVAENLCFACPTCNRYKASRQSATDPETEKIVPLFHPYDQRWEEHFAWNDDATEILGLTAIGRATILVLKMNRSQLTGVRRMWMMAGKHPPKQLTL